MIRTIAERLNGLESGRQRDEGCTWLEVGYYYPGRVDIQAGTGIKIRTDGTQAVYLGRLCEPDTLTEAAYMDSGGWEWSEHTKPRARVWVQNVLAADLLKQSRSYEYDGELVVVSHRLPPRVVEESLWASGFRPSLATWRARSSDARRNLLANVIEALNGGTVHAATAPALKKPSEKIAELAQHAWMRWYAVFRTELEVGGRTYKMDGRPLLRDDDLVLKFRHHSSGSALDAEFGVASHPFLHDATIVVDGQTLQRDSVAWEDLPGFVDEVGELITAQKRARRSAGRTTQRRGPSPSPSPAPTTERAPAVTWAQAVQDAFEQTPGYRLDIVPRGQQGHVIAVYPEGGGVEDAVASVDLEGDLVEGVRWLSGRLTRGAQDELMDRLEEALATAKKVMTGKPASPIDGLIAMMERRGLVLGADPARTRTRDPHDFLARALVELAEPSPSTPAEVMQWLERAGFDKAADLISKYRSGDGPSDLSLLTRQLWTTAISPLPTGYAQKEGAYWRVPCESIYSGEDGQPRVLARRLLPSGEYVLHIIRVRAVRGPKEGGITVCEIVDETGTLEPNESVYILEHEPAVYIELHDRITAFLEAVERTSHRLEDVRRLLYWTAAMIDTPRCQGQHRALVRRAFVEAMMFYDAARLQLARGNPVVAFQRVHDALRRLSSAAAAMAQACAEGQMPLTKPALAPGPEDVSVLGALARADQDLSLQKDPPPMVPPLKEPRSAGMSAHRESGPRRAAAVNATVLVRTTPPGLTVEQDQQQQPVGLEHVRGVLARAGISADHVGVRHVGRIGECRAPDPRSRDLARKALRDAGIAASIVRGRLVFPLGVP